MKLPRPFAGSPRISGVMTNERVCESKILTYSSFFSAFSDFYNLLTSSFQKINENTDKYFAEQTKQLKDLSNELVKLNSKKLKKLVSIKSKNQINKKKVSTDLVQHFFKINFCNTRSLFNKLSLITTYISSRSIDLIFFTETWLSKNISDSMICPKGYNIIRKDRSTSRGGGVCLFYKSHLKVVEIPQNNGNLDLDSKFDYLCVDTYDGKLPIRLLCIYIPPCSSRNLQIVNHMCSIIKKLSFHSSNPFYFFGDFNLPLIDWNIPKSKGDSAHDAFLDFCLSQNFCQFINVPTHQKGNILDLLLCNTPAKYKLLNYNVDSPITETCDHNLISFQVQISSSSSHTQTLVRFPNFSRANYTKIYEHLIHTSWVDVVNSSLSLQRSYDNFLKILHSSIDQYIPKVISKSGTRSKRPSHIRRLLREKLSYYKNSKHDPNFKLNYKVLSKQYEAAVKAWHNKLEADLCNNPSSKKFFKYVKTKFKSQAPIPPLYDENEQLVMSDREKANLFNRFFQSVFIHDNGNALDLTPRVLEKMAYSEISYVEILDAVHDSKDKISRTPDQVPIYFIKRVIGPLLTPLLFLFNSFYKNGFVPNQWKMANIIPVFKKGNRNKAQNYRPISLTSSFCRLFESIISKRILYHLQNNSLLSTKQFGFLPKKSTTSNLITCYYNWLVSFSSNHVTDVVYTDISKAFDTVSHVKLISVLVNYGLNKCTITWIKNFLEIRQQQVSIGSFLSDPLPVWSGVPQGSVLGPLLFIIFINDITNCSKILNPLGDLSLFADDAKFFGTNQHLLQSSLNFVTSWTKDRQLKLAEKKCLALQICKPAKRKTSKFTLNDYELNQSPNIKDLGIYISSDLKWADHISFIYNKASVKAYQILKTFQTNNFSTLLKLYLTYIRPILEHNTVLWSPWMKKDILKIESIQRNYLRKVFMKCGISFSSYSERLIKSKIKSLHYRRSIFDLHLLYKIVNNISDLQFSHFFTTKSTNYNMRGKTTKIYTKQTYNDPQWTNSFFARSVRLWNLLPDCICDSKTLKEFKTKLDNFDLSQFIDQLFV